MKSRADRQLSLPPLPVNSIDGDGRSGLPERAAHQSSSIPLTSLVKDALIRHYGTLKAAGISLRYDQGQLTRDLQTGDFKLKKLDVDPDAKAFVVAVLYEAIGSPDPKARMRRAIRVARAQLDELAELTA